MSSPLINLSLIQLALTVISFIFPPVTGAQVSPPDIILKPVIGFSSINQAAGTLIGFAFLGGALLAFYYIILGAIKYISSGENSANTTAARQTIMNAAIGLILLGAVYVIFKLATGLIPGLGQFFS